MKILVVDDEKLLVKGIKFNLENDGYEVAAAYDGEEAVERFRESEPFAFDAVLMDMQMPELDGCEAARRIRALDRPDALSTPIVAVTANAFAEDVKKSLDAGMNAHLSKPVDLNALEQTLQRFRYEPSAEQPQ